MKQSVQIHSTGQQTQVVLPQPRLTYLERIMRSDSFIPLNDLYRKAQSPAKEFTESYSALFHLRQSIKRNANYRVIHIGDGAHARTAAMFAFMSKTENISVDPKADGPLIDKWKFKWRVERLSYIRGTIENAIPELNKMEVPTILTFVHAHVKTDLILDRMYWDAAFVMPCCQKNQQLSKKKNMLVKHDMDWNVLSPEREYQVLIDRDKINAQ